MTNILNTFWVIALWKGRYVPKTQNIEFLSKKGWVYWKFAIFVLGMVKRHLSNYIDTNCIFLAQKNPPLKFKKLVNSKWVFEFLVIKQGFLTSFCLLITMPFSDLRYLFKQLSYWKLNSQKLKFLNGCNSLNFQPIHLNLCA